MTTRTADDLAGLSMIMEDSMAHVAGRIGEVLAQGATIRAGEVAIVINDTRPFIHAYRPTLDTLTIETGGTRPAALLLIVDRERGAII